MCVQCRLCRCARVLLPWKTFAWFGKIVYNWLCLVCFHSNSHWVWNFLDIGRFKSENGVCKHYLNDSSCLEAFLSISERFKAILSDYIVVKQGKSSSHQQFSFKRETIFLSFINVIVLALMEIPRDLSTEKYQFYLYFSGRIYRFSKHNAIEQRCVINKMDICLL